MHPVKRWIIVISGYLQNEGSAGNGMVGLWSELDHCCKDATVLFRTWNDNWWALSEMIWRLQPKDTSVEVNIIGYSWGGYSSTILARELQKKGISVRYMILSDPVYRSFIPSWIVKWLSAVAWWSKIKVPSNVRNVRSFYQTENLPRGHKLVAENPELTVVMEPVKVDMIHTYMDNSPEFHTFVKTLMIPS